MGGCRRAPPRRPGVSTGRIASKGRSALAAVEMCLSLVLLIAAGLMMRSVGAQLAIPAGFDVRDLMLARVELSGPNYDALAARVNARNGIVSVARATGAPLAGGESVAAALPGDDRGPADLPKVRYRAASQNYFRVLGVSLERGRDFTPGDSGRSVAIINRSMAAHSGRDRIRSGGDCSCSEERFRTLPK